MHIPRGNGGNVRHPSPLIAAQISFNVSSVSDKSGLVLEPQLGLRSLVHETLRLGAGWLADRPIGVVSSAARGKFQRVVGHIAPRW